MPEVDMPLFSGVYKNIDESVSNDKLFKMIDAILDDAPSIFSRPGLSNIKTSASGRAFDGLFYVKSLSLLFGISDGKLYSYNSALTETDLSSAGVSINPGVRPTWAFDGTNLYVANGTRIMYTNGVAATAYIADAEAPTAVTHIMIIDSYLIANSVASGTWYFSTPGAADTWSALDFATAESQPDPIIAGINFRDEAYFFGADSMEIWEDDGETPFIRVNGAAFNVGCVAPYSVIALDNEVMWLAPNKRFVRFAGSGVESISTQYDKEIAAFTTISDCTADRYDILGKSLVVFQFPSEGRTIVYNQTNDNWGEFGYWNSGSGAYEAFLGACHAFVPEWDKHIVGSRKQTGKLYEMKSTYLTDDGDPIRMLTRTGHVNYGTNNFKRNDSITFRAKRGFITDTSEPVMTLRYRDQNGEWSNEIQISMGLMGDYFNLCQVNRMGRYSSRQYEFVCSDPVGIIFSEAKEDFIMMSR